MTPADPLAWRKRAGTALLTFALLLGVRTSAHAAVEVPIEPSCGPGHVNVRDFYDGSGDYSTAFARAVSALPGGGVLTVPAGSHLLRRHVMVNTDGICIKGDPGARVVVDPVEGDLDINHYAAFIANKPAASGTGLDAVRNVWVQDLRIEVRKGVDGPISQGVVQYNNCRDCGVERSQVVWTGAADIDLKGRSTDGIAFSQGSSGWISEVRVDGMPKVGILMTMGAHDVLIDEVETVNSGARNGAGGYWGAGIALGGSSRITVRSAVSSGNRIAGILVGAVGGGVLGWHPARDSVITDCTVSGNGTRSQESAGLIVNSEAFATDHVDVLPEGVQVDDLRSYANNGHGIYVSSGRHVAIRASTVRDNTDHGILVANATHGEGRIADLTADVSIQGSYVYRNGTVLGVHSGSVALRAVKDVEVRDSVLWGAGQAGNTLVLMSALAGAPGPDVRSSGVRLSGIDVRNTLTTWVGGESESGAYDIAGSGSPNAYRGIGLAAPLGSHYTDTAGGRRYLKTTGSLTATGWS
ncbi:right-handed parallel beta-helix repeat-containing protein [Streptomyces sp. NPDC050625]|uniref:right-handed parallel beta-helix repeat-containing protein n=1 Tax=Streptomyces sp. NPDC050625 TaxID=3154629 RepID=UPI0034139E31